MKKILLSALLMAVLTGCGSSTTPTQEGTNPPVVETKPPTFEAGVYGDLVITSNWEIPDGALFLDIRNDWERVQVRPEGAVGGAIYELRSPSNQGSGGSSLNPSFVAEVLELAGDMDREIILICASGSRSASAAQLLANEGFTGVWDALGGMNNWSAVKPNETITNSPI